MIKLLDFEFRASDPQVIKVVPHDSWWCISSEKRAKIPLRSSNAESVFLCTYCSKYINSANGAVWEPTAGYVVTIYHFNAKVGSATVRTSLVFLWPCTSVSWTHNTDQYWWEPKTNSSSVVTLHTSAKTKIRWQFTYPRHRTWEHPRSCTDVRACWASSRTPTWDWNCHRGLHQCRVSKLSEFKGVMKTIAKVIPSKQYKEKHMRC